MVIVLSRHGVRSPTHPTELQANAAQTWPAWPGKPGNLTEHGARADETVRRVLPPDVRRVAGHRGKRLSSGGFGLRFWADVDQRTRATGDAILAGLAPGCNIAVGHAPADPDPLFDPLPGIGVVNKAESMASVLGAVGGNLNALTVAYGGAFAAMELVLGCESPATCKRISQVPTTVANDGDGGLAGLSGGLDMAGDVAENMLLEYLNGNVDALAGVAWITLVCCNCCSFTFSARSWNTATVIRRVPTPRIS